MVQISPAYIKRVNWMKNKCGNWEQKNIMSGIIEHQIINFRPRSTGKHC